MCDYSLGGLPNRLAVDGEELSLHRFSTGSLGLASSCDLRHAAHVERPVHNKTIWESIKSFFAEPPKSDEVPAVCVPPGARLLLKTVPSELQHLWGIEEEQNVRFVQTSADENRYRDALELPNGRQVLLQELREGMHLQVISTGSLLDHHLEDALDGAHLPL
jgi:hypothetical protein